MKIQKILALSFVALGPLGNLLTPYLLPPAFRFYYFILLGFPFFFTVLYQRQFKILILFVPLLLYCLPSSFFVEINQTYDEPYPIFRYFLLLFHFLFILGASSVLQDKYEAITLYLKSFFISLGVGYFFYIGYYLDFFSFPIVERYSVLTQFAYHLLRFSPGSYPNEYGTLCSFVLSILTFLLLKPCPDIPLRKKSLIFFFILTTVALILTTTRSAYLSYLFCLPYLCFKTKRYFLPLFFFFCAIITIFILLRIYEIDLLDFLSVAFNFQAGSFNERMNLWANALDDLHDKIWLGKGFATLTIIHNVYLQVLFELGFIGLSIFLATLLFRLLNGPFFFSKSEDTVFSIIKMLGLFHILWFALSNHNLNHHLTWFVFLLFLIPVKKKALAY